MTSPTKTAQEVWGPQAQPIHTTVPESDFKAPYRDNSYVMFFDPPQKAYFAVHIMSSPNTEALARASASVEGTEVEIFEPLEQPQGQGITIYRSKSIMFDVTGRVAVNSPELCFDFHMKPHWATMIDWGDFMLPAGGPPHEHYDRTVDFTGPCEIKGRKYDISATGHRDRALGFRDESANWREYCWVYGVFPEYTVSVLRMLGKDNIDVTRGFVNDDNEIRQVDSLAITRNPAGLFAEALIGLKGGEELTVRSLGREAGFWVPMGWERRGPTMSAYQEFCPYRTGDGVEGFGNVEHAALRMIY